MSKMSFLDKLKVLGDVTSSSGLFIIAIIMLAFLGYLFLTTNKSNAKSSKKVYLLIYVAIIVFVLVSYGSSFSKMWDYMMNNFFIVLYFPNLAVYLAAIIVTNIILWYSMFNYQMNKIIKTINITLYCLMQYLFILILSVITNKKLDVFTLKSVYTNKDALALIELSSIIFIVWMIFLIVYKILTSYLNRNKKDKEIVITKNINITNAKQVAKNHEPHIVPETITIVKENNINTNTNLNSYSQTTPYDHILTIDDYKLLLNILKEQKNKDLVTNETNDKAVAEAKYKELQDLYKSL
jgi:hypothetical protein